MEQTKTWIKDHPAKWLVTGAAGFIGSNLVEALLKLDQRVVGLDNFLTGHQKNLDDIKKAVTDSQWSNFKFIRGDIQNLEACQEAAKGMDYVLHQAALGSVPRSIAEPLECHQNNVNGHMNMLVAARDQQVKRFVYASSSSVYGDHPKLPKVESEIGQPLSPYAASKQICEIYSEVFSKTYNLETIGLRYFNVFGPRQDPNGPYAAVIPRWIDAIINNRGVTIFGDGKTSRDFNFVQNVVQMNLLSATTENRKALNQVFNSGLNNEIDLNQLFAEIKDRLKGHYDHVKKMEPSYADFRAGDIPHSRADISLSQELLGFKPTHNISKGLDETIDWYMK